MNLLLFFSLSCFFRFVKGAPEVTVEQGKVIGKTVDFNEDETSVLVDVFQGIPFAEPPVRFSAPKPKEPWTSDWNATYFRPACFQIETNSWRPWASLLEVDEDCLYLNIYAPNPKPVNAPVMVYIHGGSYNTGTAMEYDLSGVPLAAFEGVIVVVINYRLNVFGYLSTGDEAAPGNFGFLDQAEALKWIRANIQAFGGDNGRITIFGESAGSGSVDFHRFSKYSRDLFDRSILQSGSAIAWWSFVSDPDKERAQAFSLGKKVDCDSEDTAQLIDCLRNVEASKLYSAYSSNNYNWWPNLDGVFLDESPFDLLARGDVKDAPMMVGYNKDEGTLIVPSFYPMYLGKQEPPYVSRMRFDLMVKTTLAFRRDIVNEIIEDATKQEYVDWSQVDNATSDYFLQYLPIYGDLTFSCPANEIIRAHASSMESPVFQYFLTHVPTTSYYERDGEGTGWFLAGHVEDLPFVFGWGFNEDIKNLHPWTDEERDLSRKIMTFWANFARSGDPSKISQSDPPGTGWMEWPSFTIPELTYKELSLDLPVRRGLKTHECAFWGSFLKDLTFTLEFCQAGQIVIDDVYGTVGGQWTHIVQGSSMDDAELQWREDYNLWKKDLQSWRDQFNDYQESDMCP